MRQYNEGKVEAKRMVAKAKNEEWVQLGGGVREEYTG